MADSATLAMAGMRRICWLAREVTTTGMTSLALTLVLFAGVAHASWNFLLKRSGGGIAFMWLFTLVSIAFYAPIAAVVIMVKQPQLGITALSVVLASAVVNTIYYLLLERGYRYGDLSVVYPLARATGPLITIVDKLGVATVLVPPLVFYWGVSIGRFLMLAPLALRDRGKLADIWHFQRRSVIVIGILCPLSYILALTAMVFTPISYVAPSREIAILFGAVMGTQLLREGDAKRRLISAAAMAFGVAGPALG